MPTVFVVNRSSHDYTQAKRFGELLFMTEGGVSRYAVNRMYREFTDAMYNSKPDDYILITGLTVMCCIACSMFVARHGKLNLLLYKNGSYVERRMVFDYQKG